MELLQIYFFKWKRILSFCLQECSLEYPIMETDTLK